jgi:hypothetical protein
MSIQTKQMKKLTMKKVSMKFWMPSVGIRPDVYNSIKQDYSKGIYTLDLMKLGKRTASTRSYPLGKIGEKFYCDTSGYIWIITNVGKLPKNIDNNKYLQKVWSKREGWTWEYAREHHSKQVAPGKIQTKFKLYENKDK